MGHKRMWYVRTLAYLSQMVNWGCHTTPTDDGFSRYVQLITDLEGREIVLKLSPNEARAIGSQLISQADQVDAMNARHDNGGTYLIERQWAY